MEIKTFIIYLLVCFGLSFLIGVERQFRRRIIGLRTTILVSIGSFLYVTFSFVVDNADLTRIAAQVVTGIGFLGAGVIIKDGFKVRGLTTAATLWCDAAIGVLCAGGALTEALIGTIVILFSNVILRYVNVLINKKVDERHKEEEYILKVNCSKELLMKVKNEINDFIKDHNKAIVRLKSANVWNENAEYFLEVKIGMTKTLENSMQRLIDSMYNKYEFKSLEYSKLGGENEEEEEAL